MRANEQRRLELTLPPSTSPPSISIIESVKKTSHCVTVESGFPAFGVGSEILAQLCESEARDYLDEFPERVTGADVPTPYAANLEALSFPDAEIIKKVVRRNLYRSS